MKMLPSIPAVLCRPLMAGALAVLLTSPGFSAAAIGSKKIITLDEAYDRTLLSDQSARTAYIEIRKANLLPWSALTKLTPRVTAGATLNHSETHYGAFGTPAWGTDGSAQNENVTVQQTLVDFTFFPTYRLAKLTGVASRLQYRLTLRDVLFGVAKGYYEVLKQEKIVSQDNETVDLANKQLQLSQNQYDAGAVARVDVLRGQSTLESARQALISDQNTLLLYHDTLANTLNLHGEARDFDVVQPEDAGEHTGGFEDDLAQAYLHREDYKLSSINVAQNVEQKNVVVGEYAPTVSALFSPNWADSTGASHTDSWNAAVSVQVPVFTGGQREIDLRTAHHNIDEAKIAVETAAKTVESDVETTWLQVETLRETIQSLKSQVVADEQNYKDLLNQYQAGSATSLDTQSGLAQLVTSKTNLIAQTFEYQIALRDLQRSMAAFQNQRVEKVPLPHTAF